MQKITWREGHEAPDGTAAEVVTIKGVNLGPVVKDGVTLLVIYCDDGLVREVPIDDIVPY